MKEYIIRKLPNNEQEKGYNLQKIDIKMLMDLGIMVPDKIKEMYGKGFGTSELKDFIYFNDDESTEFIRTQPILRDYIEFAGMNSFELDLLISYYKKRIENINDVIKKINSKKDLIDLEHQLIILKSEMQSLIYLRDDVIKEEKKLK